MRKVLQKRHQTKCSKCKELLSIDRIGKNAYCKKCHAAYQRKNRKPYGLLSAEQKKRANARSYAKVYLKRGLISKQPCEKCGSLKSEMHHPDYNRPLFIKWLCRGCHMDEHNHTIELEHTKRVRHREDNGKGRKPTCSKCQGPIEENRKGKYGYCKKCHAAYVKNTRKISSPAACN